MSLSILQLKQSFILFRRADGATLHARKATRLKSALSAIYRALNIDSLPGGVQKPWCDIITLPETFVVPYDVF